MDKKWKSRIGELKDLIIGNYFLDIFRVLFIYMDVLN